MPMSDDNMYHYIVGLMQEMKVVSARSITEKRETSANAKHGRLFGAHLPTDR